MELQRRVSLPAPARTTRMNGGPRLRVATPLPPYCASVRDPRHLAPRGLERRDRSAHTDMVTPRAEPPGQAPVEPSPGLARAAGVTAIASPVYSGPAETRADEWSAAEPPVEVVTEMALRSARTYTPPAVVGHAPPFPMDAFIIPEGAARLPSGVGEAAVRTHVALQEGDEAPQPASASATLPTPDLVDTAPLAPEPPPRPRGAALREQRAHDVADRLEALAGQLRHHGYEVLAQKSVRGDALDALLAGVIAGYLVAAE